MSTYLVGDIHGCFDEFQALLDQVAFHPQSDRLWLTGDLIARGPDSLAVLRYVSQMGDAVRMVLGNHDLHLLGIYAGISYNKPKDRLSELLAADDLDDLIYWLRQQPLLQVDDELQLVMSHAGITPQWSLATAQECAYEVSSILQSSSYPLFLNAMYGDMPNFWLPELTGLARLRFSTNVLTRMRYCFTNGQLDMLCKDAPDQAPRMLTPWFNQPSQVVEQGYSIAFGHWAALEGKGTPQGIYALDTGCCWGGCLSMMRWEDKKWFSQPAHKESGEKSLSSTG